MLDISVSLAACLQRFTFARQLLDRTLAGKGSFSYRTCCWHVLPEGPQPVHSSHHLGCRACKGRPLEEEVAERELLIHMALVAAGQ